GKPLRDESGSGGQRELEGLDRPFDVLLRRRLRGKAQVAGGRNLSLGQPVHVVVHDDVRDVRVAPYRVQEVPHADGVAVAVSARRDDGERAVGQLDAGRGGQGPAVHHVQVVAVDVVADLARAADAGHDGHVVWFDLQVE